MVMRRLLAILVLLPGLALADSYRDSLEDTTDSLDDAISAAKRSGGACKGILPNLSRAIDDVDSVRRSTNDRRLVEIQTSIANLVPVAGSLRCGPKVADRISRAMVSMTAARQAMGDNNGQRHRHR